MQWLHPNWRFRKVHVDASAHAIVDSLTAKMLPVGAVSFSMQGKVELHSRLKSAFEGGRITIPRHPDLLRELSSFEYKISEAGNLLLHGGRDDRVDSLALAARDLTSPAFRPSIFGVEIGQNRFTGRGPRTPLSEVMEEFGVPDEQAYSREYTQADPKEPQPNCRHTQQAVSRPGQTVCPVCGKEGPFSS